VKIDVFPHIFPKRFFARMLEVAGGTRSLEDFTALLDGAHRRDAGPTAPPHGLYLASVSYPQGS